MDETISNADTGTTGYDHFGTYPQGGYTCPTCGAWVAYNTLHSCYSVSPPYYYGDVPTWQPNYNPVLDEIKALLEKVIELLSRE